MFDLNKLLIVVALGEVVEAFISQLFPIVFEIGASDYVGAKRRYCRR